MKRYPKITLKRFMQTVKTPVLSRFDNQVVKIYDYIVKMNYVKKSETLNIYTHIFFKYGDYDRTLECRISDQLFNDSICSQRYFQQANIATTTEDWRAMKSEMLRLMLNVTTKWMTR